VDIAYSLCRCSAQWFGRENVWLLGTFGVTFVLGTVILVATFSTRLYRGDVRLRPWDAAKRAVVLFLIVLGLRLLAWLIFPALDRDLAEAIAVSALFAIIFSLYSTAYRKPA
jgi:uncharacterized iron-regulated membrane protein